MKQPASAPGSLPRFAALAALLIPALFFLAPRLAHAGEVPHASAEIFGGYAYYCCDPGGADIESSHGWAAGGALTIMGNERFGLRTGFRYRRAWGSDFLPVIIAVPPFISYLPVNSRFDAWSIMGGLQVEEKIENTKLSFTGHISGGWASGTLYFENTKFRKDSGAIVAAGAGLKFYLNESFYLMPSLTAIFALQDIQSLNLDTTIGLGAEFY